jgi:hypothetical protein
LTESAGGYWAVVGTVARAAANQRNSVHTLLMAILRSIAEPSVKADTGAAAPLEAGLSVPSIFPQDAPC